MQRNVGTTDGAIRILVGLGLLGSMFFVDGDARWFGLVGFIPLLTVLTGNCPLYSLFGVSSCERPPERRW